MMFKFSFSVSTEAKTVFVSAWVSILRMRGWRGPDQPATSGASWYDDSCAGLLVPAVRCSWSVGRDFGAMDGTSVSAKPRTKWGAWRVCSGSGSPWGIDEGDKAAQLCRYAAGA